MYRTRFMSILNNAIVRMGFNMKDEIGKSAKTLAVANHKGGVGKTTTVINLAAEFGRAGLKVLVVDMDPQANASLHIGLKHPSEVAATTADLLLSGVEKLPQAVHEETTLENVSLIYGSLALGKAEDELRDHATRPNEELRQQLSLLNDLYDVILIDCPPSLKLLTSNALAAATHVIVPIESGSQYGLYGVSDLTRHINKIRRINPGLEVIGALLLRHDERQNICRVIKNGAEAEIGRLLPVTIATSNKIGRAAIEKKGVRGIDRSARVSREFRDLAAYLIDELGLPGTPPVDTETEAEK